MHNSRKHHSGIESAIGSFQRGNGMKRCELGFERYLGLAVLRNIHVLGKLLIAQANTESQSAKSKREKCRLNQLKT